MNGDINHQQARMQNNSRTNGFVQHERNGQHSSVLLNRVAPEAAWLDWSKYDTNKGSFEECSYTTALLTHLGFYLLMLLGYISHLLFTPKVAVEYNREGYAPLYNPFDQFYSRYVYRRLRHCFNRPITSAPGAELVLKERITEDNGWTFSFTGTERCCINLGSYNYLGFAAGDGQCADDSIAAIEKYGISLASPRAELGECVLHRELEEMTARFLGVEAALVVGMGFATNTLGLPALLGKDCLVLSDERNHASLILGLRLAGATVRVFKHNDVKHLERLARVGIAEARWCKIVVVVEGVYSMEGSVVPLPAVIAIKKRYNLHLYLDEAHSIGAMGPRGRGITDYYGIDPRDVDVLMGTFTKSFGSAGGYIAGSRRVVEWVRAHGHAHSYAQSMPPVVAQQVLSSMKLIGWGEGVERVRTLRRNTRYFRARLRRMGVIVYGHDDSPVVPMLVYEFSKMAATVERLTEHNIAVVGVGFPATPLMECRIRFCLSAAHTKQQLDHCLNAIASEAENLGLRYSRRPISVDEPVY